MMGRMKQCLGVLLVLGMSLPAGCKSPTLPDLFKDEGFAELRPPSRLIAPGSVVYKLSEDPLNVGIACTQMSSLGEDIPLADSSSSSTNFQKGVRRSFMLAPEDLGPVTAQAGYEKISTIQARLSNVHVYELPVSTLVDRLEYRADACKKAINLLVKQEKKVGLVTAVVEADAQYTIDFQQGISAEVQSELLGKLGGELGFENVSTTTSTVSGTKLFWGMRELPEEDFLSLEPKGAADAYKVKSFAGTRPVIVSSEPPMAP